MISLSSQSEKVQGEIENKNAQQTYTGGLCDGGGLPMHCALAGSGGAAMGGGILETFIGDMVVWIGG